MSRPAKLRVGFIGAGANTRLRHLPGFASIEGVELAAVANRTMATAGRVAVEFGIGNVRSDWRQIIADDSIDAVCIGTWPNTHAEMTCAALAAGKHVLVEARMASTLAEAEKMQEATLARPDLVAQIVPSPITLEADEIIHGLVAAGELGEVVAIESEHLTKATLDSAAPLHWRMDERISGINTMALGICYEPLQRWFGLEAEVDQAEAAVVTPVRNTRTGEEHDIVIPERLEVHGRIGGARLIMRQSSVEPGEPVCRYRISGTNAALDYDVNGRRLLLKRPGSTPKNLELPTRLNGGWEVEPDFVSSIRAGDPVKLTDFASGVRYMRFTDAVWQAWHGDQ